MFDIDNHPRSISVITPTNLYKWNANYFRLQQSLFEHEFVWIREKQIRDFVDLNGFERVCLIRDTQILDNLGSQQVNQPSDADLVVVTDQRLGRVTCPNIIEQIKNWLHDCPRIYLCLNRHYLNIDNSWHDATLDDDFQRAITQWLSRELSPARVIDLSLCWDDRGDYLSWSIPDRHHYISL